MKRSKVLWVLVALNALLVVGLAWKLGFENSAKAQVQLPPPAPRPPGEMVMVPASIPGSPNGAVYMLDTRNGILSGFVLDPQKGTLDPMPPIPLQRVFQAPRGGR